MIVPVCRMSVFMCVILEKEAILPGIGSMLKTVELRIKTRK